MSKEKNNLVPKLRFPEFEEDGEWIMAPFSEVYSFKITNSLSRDKLNYDKGSVKNIHYGDIHTKFSTLFDIKKETVPYINSDISTEGIDQDNYCIEGDMVFADASEDLEDVGKSIEIVNLNNEKLLAGLHTFLARQIRPTLIIGFGGYLFKSNNIRTQIKRESQGAKVLGISKGRISDIKIYFPERKEEQKKIAACLSSLEELIAAHNDKLQALKDHKKSLMQTLFPQEGEKVPKYRFPGFENEWKVGEVADLADTIMGNAFKSSDFVKEGIQLIRMGNLYQGELNLYRSPVCLPNGFEKEYSRFLVQPFDLLMSMTGTVGKRDYGFIVQTPEWSNALLLNQRVIKFVPKENCVKGFLLQLLKSESFLHQLYSRPGGTKQANLSVNELKVMTVAFPKPEEQQKIASCLSVLDELITAQTEKIDQLQFHKKGLMQDLFPRIYE